MSHVPRGYAPEDRAAKYASTPHMGPQCDTLHLRRLVQDESVVVAQDERIGPPGPPGLPPSVHSAVTSRVRVARA